jgi:aerobic carbon-monoxide dehydrogenase large subunit
VKFTEDRREHFISSAHERAQLQHVDRRLRRRRPAAGPRRPSLARQRRLHAVRADRADHHLHPAAGPLQARSTGSSSTALYTNTVIVTPYRGAGRPQGCYAMERTMDAIAAYLGQGPHRGAPPELHPARRVPLRPPPVFQDGRRLIYDSGDYPACWRSSRRPGRLGRFEEFRAEAAPGHAGRHRHRDATSRAPAPAPTRAATCRSRQRQGARSPPASPARARATRPRSPRSSPTSSACRFEDVEVTTGDTRRCGYAVGTFASRAAVMSGSAIAPGRPRRPGEGAADRCGRAGGRRRRPRDRRGPCRSRARPGVDRRSAPSRCSPTRCATPSTRPPRPPPSSPVGDPSKPPVAEDDEPGLEGKDYYSPSAPPSPTACTPWWSRPTRTPPRSRSSTTPWSTTAVTSSTR